MQTRFDEFAKALASQTSRRGVLRALGAGVAAALFGRPVLEPHGARAVVNPCNCPGGCCIAGTTYCLAPAGQSTTLCGNTGGTCAPCPPTNICLNGACVSIAPPAPPPPAPCGPGNCAGCCLSAGPNAPATCVQPAGQNAAGCGRNGSTCAPCPQNATCLNGTCISCSSSTCPNGCCSGNTCIPYASQSQYTCGAAGAVCSPCLAQASNCMNGVCVSCASVPAGTSCGPNSICCHGLCLATTTARALACYPAHCSNSMQDVDETDVDCGGSCAPCAQGKDCNVSADCQSGFCVGGVCCNSACTGACQSCLGGLTGLATGVCGSTCSAIQACCGGQCQFVDSPTMCGACGNVCPGFQQLNDNVTCNANEQCTFSCQGENYDVNNNPNDGCERAASPQGIHLQTSAQDEGQVSTCSGTFSFNGTLLSDSRVHEQPSIVGFDAVSGSAPNWHKIFAVGHTFCLDELSVTLTVTGGTPTCYQLKVITDKNTYSAQVTSNRIASINPISETVYSDNTDIYFEVLKTCSTSVQEAMTYTISGQLQQAT